MRKIYKSNRLLHTLLLCATLGVSGLLSAQISGGTVTINSGSATLGNNYNNFADFRTALVATTLTSALTVNVQTNHTVSSAINLPAIAGASSTNTITIAGGAFVLDGAIASDAVILFNGADFVTIRNLTIRNTSATAPMCIRFQNASDNNIINRCNLEFSAIASGSTTSGCYLGFTSSPTSYTTTMSTSMGINNTIDGNTLRTTNTNSPGPAMGILNQGNSSNFTSTAANNTISNNIIQNFFWTGIYCINTNGLQITGNDISRANSSLYNCNTGTNYGILSQNAYSANRQILYNSNNIHDIPFVGSTTSSTQSAFYGVFITNNFGTSSNRMAANSNTIRNIQASSILRGISSQFSYFCDFNSNTIDNIDMPSNSGTFHGIWNSYPYNTFRMNSNAVRNCDGSSTWYGLFQNYVTNPTAASEMNSNTINANNGGNIFYGINSEWNNSVSTVTNQISMNRNTVTNNTQSVFNYNYQYGMSSRYYGFYEMNDNLIQNNSFSSYYGCYLTSEWYTNVKIQRNRVLGNRNLNSSGGNAWCIYIYYLNNVDVTDNLIQGNIGLYGTYGIYAFSFSSGTFTANIRQNTIIIDGSLSSYSYHYSYPIYSYLYYHTRINIIGNIIDSKNNYGFQYYCVNQNNTAFVIDNNSFDVRNHSYTYWGTGSGGGNTFATWAGNGLTGPGELNLSANPGHSFAGNYASNRFVNQNNVVTLPAINNRDVYGVLRNPSNSDRGAVEGVLDIQQVSNTFAPNSTECAGYTVSPTLTLRNTFPETVTGFRVACSDNGVVIATAVVSASIATGTTGTVTFAPIRFSRDGVRRIRFFLLNADDVPSNDTLSTTFTITRAPGGSILSRNTGTATKAIFDITGKPDVTTNGQSLIYDLTAPSRVGYTNSDYGTRWTAFATAVTARGVNANSQISLAGAPLVVTVNPSLGFVDSTLTVSIRIVDLITGCDTVYSRRVLVAPQGVPDFIIPGALCDKSDIAFENTSTVTSGGLLHDWNFGDGSPNESSTNPAHRFPTFGNYTITLKTTTAPWGYETTKTMLITVSEVPTAAFSIVNACQGTAVKLTNGTTIGSGLLTYTWNYGDGSPLNNTSSAAVINKMYAVPGGYPVTLTAFSNGCSNSLTKNVYTFAKPVANFVKLQGNCDNEMYNFKNASTIANGQFGNYWDFNDAGSKATVENPSYDFTTAGPKSVKLKVVSEFGCSDSLTTIITVKPASVSDFTFPFACSRTATQFTNTTAVPAATTPTYTWNFGDGVTTTATSPSHPWSSIGPKNVKLSTVLSNGCKDEVTKTINVGVQPLISFQVADQCAGSDVPFVNLTNYTQGTIKYTWNFGDGQGSSEGSPKHNFTIGGSAQSFNVSLKGEVLGGCADSLTKNVTINPKPATCTFNMTRDYNLSLTAYKFTPVGNASGLTYTWLTGDGNSVPSNGTGTSYSYQDKGKFCVTMIARNLAGCECSSTQCRTLTLGTDNVSLNKVISIFPNPTNGLFSVKLDGIADAMIVNVYNTLGALVNTVTVNTNTAEIDMSNFASGIYVVKVIAGNQIGTTKITVAK